MPPFDLAVRLRVVQCRSDVRHTRDPNELLKVPCHELRPIVGDDPQPCLRVFLPAALEDDLNFSFCHRPAHIPLDNRPAVAAQHAAQVVERAADINAGNVDMPMLMRFGRLPEPGALLRRLAFPLRQKPGLPQYPPHTGGSYRHDVGIHHHEAQSPIASQRVLQMETDDRRFLPLHQPKLPGNPAVVVIGPAISFEPAVILAGCDTQPHNKSSSANLGRP